PAARQWQLGIRPVTGLEEEKGQPNGACGRTFKAAGSSPLTCCQSCGASERACSASYPQAPLGTKLLRPSVAERSASFGIAVMRPVLEKLFGSRPNSAKTSQRS